MSIASLALAALALALPGRHTPHGNINAIATAPLPGGGTEVLAVATVDVGFDLAIRSRDDGLTWEILSGAGLETRRAIDVVFHPGLQGSLGPGLFLISTNDGVYSYDPGNGAVLDWSAGLAAADRAIVDLDTPLSGSSGPAAAISAEGRVYLRAPGSAQWALAFDSGLNAEAERARVAVEPHFLAGGPPGPGVALLAAVNKVLYSSADGGTSWQVHPRFNFPVTDVNGFQIRDLAFAEDFQQGGGILVAQGQESPAAGRILLSRDFGQSFTVTYTADTEIAALLATPRGPSGVRHVFAAPLAYPWLGGPGIGILRSDDGGLTWDDFGNPQDFILREDGQSGFSVPRLIHLLDMGVSPRFRQDGRVWLSRDQGLLATDDAGIHWRWVRTRPEIDTRVLAGAMDAVGDRVVYSGHYGSGTYRMDLDTGAAEDLNLGNAHPYVKTLAVSPNHDADGTVVFGVFEELMLWFDPRVSPPANPYGVSGWVQPPLSNPSQHTGEGFPRTVAISSNYHGGGLPGTDQTLFYNAFFRPPERSADAGLTAERVWQLGGGGVAPFMKALKIAPTYDAANPAAHSDVYGLTASGDLYRLQADVWTLLTNLPGTGQRLVLDPAYSRPSNPRLFVVSRLPSALHVIVDQPGNLQVTTYTAGLADVDVTGMAVSPDLSSAPYIYVSTIGSGVFRTDISAPAPVFQPVGSGFPPYWNKCVALSPDYLNDGIVFAGTADGNWWTVDQGPAQPWSPAPLKIFRDEEHTMLTPFAPGDPANPDPTRMWPWLSAPHKALPFPMAGRGPAIAGTRIDGSYWLGRELLRRLEVYTAAGNGMGSLKITLTRLGSGTQVSKTVDLGLRGGPPRERTVTMTLPSVEPVEIRLEALLDPGEALLFDGIGVQR